jgi:hypothetical protein
LKLHILSIRVSAEALAPLRATTTVELGTLAGGVPARVAQQQRFITDVGALLLGISYRAARRDYRSPNPQTQLEHAASSLIDMTRTESVTRKAMGNSVATLCKSGELKVQVRIFQRCMQNKLTSNDDVPAHTTPHIAYKEA